MVLSVYSVLFFVPIIFVGLAITFFSFRVMHRLKFVVTAIFTTLGLHFALIPLFVIAVLGIRSTTSDVYFNQFLLFSAMLQVLFCPPFVWWLAHMFNLETEKLTS